MGVVLFACIAIIVMCNSYDTYERQNVNRIKLINEKPKAVVKEKITEKLAQKQTKEIKKNNQDKVSKNKETVYVIKPEGIGIQNKPCADYSTAGKAAAGRKMAV